MCMYRCVSSVQCVCTDVLAVYNVYVQICYQCIMCMYRCVSGVQCVCTDVLAVYSVYVQMC